MKQKLLLLGALFCWLALNAPFLFAAVPTIDKIVKGTVKDGSTNEALIGSTVTLKGTTKGVITDVNGNYSIAVPDDNAVLVFAFIGYDPQEIRVGTQSEINVSLVSNSSELAEVVVIGYGNTRSKDVTGSVKSIKSEAFNKGIINSPEQLLQGKVAGVNVTASSGEPGAALNISVRGPGGVRTGSTPLFVIDGFALDNSSVGGATNPLTFLNPEDIETIDVLKDASATAIYGSRGANGVILITTKKGKKGASNLNYSTSLGYSKMARPLDVFTADEFRAEIKKIGANFIDDGGNTDWQKEISQTAFTQNHNLGLSGGTDKLKYFGSFGMQKQEGVLKNSNLDRYSGRVNLNQTFWENKLSVDVNISASSTNNERPNFQGLIGSAISANPTYVPYAADGSLKKYADGTNPMLTLALDNDLTVTNRILGNISPSLTLAKGLVYKLNFGIDNSSSSRDLQSLPNAEPLVLGGLTSIEYKNTNRLIENYLTYTMSKDVHSLTALAGHSYQKIFLQGRSFSINKFPLNDIEPRFNPGLGQDLTLVNNKPSGFATLNELQSFFSRVNYEYNDKYLATATVRVDGSSKFGANNKYGVFPSFSVGWRLSEEEFLKNTKFDDLKIRAGWGLTGNQEIPSKITQALFTSSVSATTSYPLDGGTSYPAGTTYSRLANPNIQWEVSSQIDVGLDFGLFNGALTGTVDYFNKVSRDILLEVIPADPVQPAGTLWTNVADMKIINKGLEFELLLRKKLGNKMRYEVGGNITFINNVVKNSPYTVIPSGSASGSGLTSATINGYINDQPIGTFYLRQFAGFDDKGLSIYADTNGDGIFSDKDRIAAGTALPNKIYNLNGNFSHGSFDLGVNFNGVAGNKVYDNTANANFYKLRLSKGVNTTNEATKYPEESINNSAPVSTRFLKDGAFFRLNNAVLGYTMNTSKLGIKKYVSTLRLSVTGQNLFLITKYDGFDPDVNTDRSVNGISSYGIDYLTYPKARSVIFGLNIGL
jgi:TonB-dependent starch-binding outer membrane protein SusC